MRSHTLALLITACLAALSGCSDDPAQPVTDATAGERFSVPDRGPNQGDGQAASAVDFVVQGCDQLSATQCRGTVPLTLTFSAVLLTTPKGVSWDFGDGKPAQNALVVSHTYHTPGIHDVTLTVGEATGTVSERKPKFVRVDAAAPGAACASAAACASGSCVCSGAKPCGFPLDSGLCLQACGKEQPCSGGAGKLACVDLSAAGAAEAWRTRLCLPLCAKNADCKRTGFSCRLAPGVFSWHQVCLPPLPRFVGQRCRTAAGALNPGACLGGICLPMGASGYCTAVCAPGTCPTGTRCSRFTHNAKQTVCLRRCDGSSCAGDPLLACEAPNQAGDYGFELLGTHQDPKGTRYCTPRRCKQDKECGLAGKCDSAKGGFCVLK